MLLRNFIPFVILRTPSPFVWEGVVLNIQLCKVKDVRSQKSVEQSNKSKNIELLLGFPCVKWCLIL